MTKKYPTFKVRGGRMSQKLSVAHRQREVARLYMQGQPLGIIAEEMGLAEATISQDISAVRKRWLAEATLAMDERKAQELARIDLVEEEAWKGWQRSIAEQKIYTKRTRYVRVPVKKGRKSAHKKIPAEQISEETIKTCSGDPRFLEQIERCVTLRLKVFALLKGDTTNQNQVYIDWSGLVGRGVSQNPVEEQIKMIENQSKITPQQDVIEAKARVK